MSKIDQARAFIAANERKDWQALRAAMADGIVYHNIPMPRITGADEAVAMLKQFMGAAEKIEWEIIAIAEDAEGRVLNERIDRFFLPGGKVIALPVCGVFEFAHDKVTAWRDYFDLADFQRQMAG
ncbi:MAG: nuclear transport factor 2 family protein [Alphaproteobacteria bacterium]|jgi:limonene-1,2-epoxide hydrolase|nr:nuclear transport factor 2 family protein [Alphaproteobacteria bacterium]